MIGQALAHHQAGNLSDAEQLYRELLAREPDNTEGLFLLATLCHQRNALAEALALFDRLLAAQPRHAPAHHGRGLVQHAQGNWAGAEASFRTAISADPDRAESHFWHGSVLDQMGLAEQALAPLREAVEKQPAEPDYWLVLGMVQHQLGQLQAAEASFRAVLARRFDSLEAHNNLAQVLQDQKRFSEAEAAYRQALHLQPHSVEVLNNLGILLQELGRYEESVQCHRTACELCPKDARLQVNLGGVLQWMGEVDAARQAYEQALRLDARCASAHNNLATMRYRAGDVESAIAQYEQAIAAAPDDAEAHANLGLALLYNGDYRRGWQEYEWRLKRPRARDRCRPRQRWHGEPFSGQTLLVFAEQGYGDTLQFARFLEPVKGRGGELVLECQSGLEDVLRTCPGVDRVVTRDGAPESPEDYDLQIPLLSLPGVLGVELADLPGRVPYLQADPRRMRQWAELVPGESLRVGIVWAGRATRGNLHRSGRLADFASLARVPGVSLVGLQKGEAAAEAETVDWPLTNVGPRLASFADTAAVLMHLDLLITVDTAAAHLAGALGRPVWTVLPEVADWRWLRERTDSPWYPSMRLFRQQRSEGWTPVLEQVAAELRRWSHERS